MGFLKSSILIGLLTAPLCSYGAPSPEAGTVLNIPTSQLHPTQSRYGERAMWARLGRTIRAFSEGATNGNGYKSTVALQIQVEGSVPGAWEAYAINGHHAALLRDSLAKLDFSKVFSDNEELAKRAATSFENPILPFKILGTFALPTDEFKRVLTARGWMRDKNVPETLSEMSNWDMRALAWFVRKSGAIEETDDPYQEFIWADYFAASIRLPDNSTDVQFVMGIHAAIGLAREEKAAKLPGYHKSSKTGCSDRFARLQPYLDDMEYGRALLQNFSKSSGN